MWAQTEMVYGGGGSDLELTSDQRFFGVAPACAVYFHIDAWVITWDSPTFDKKCMGVFAITC